MTSPSLRAEWPSIFLEKSGHSTRRVDQSLLYFAVFVRNLHISTVPLLNAVDKESRKNSDQFIVHKDSLANQVAGMSECQN